MLILYLQEWHEMCKLIRGSDSSYECYLKKNVPEDAAGEQIFLNKRIGLFLVAKLCVYFCMFLTEKPEINSQLCNKGKPDSFIQNENSSSKSIFKKWNVIILKGAFWQSVLGIKKKTTMLEWVIRVKKEKLWRLKLVSNCKWRWREWNSSRQH